MFGNKKTKIEEQIKDVFGEIKADRERIEEKVSGIEEMSTCMQSDTRQIMENTDEILGHVMVNIEGASELLKGVDEFSGVLRVSLGEYKALCELVQQQAEATVNLVEDNKHFTNPAKYLTELPGALRDTYHAQDVRLDEMSDYCKKMGVMALNAAIEAGRMGDGGKQFVAAAEEIRQTASIYEKAAISMKEEIASARERITELEEIVHYLVSSLKDSNMSAAKLLKKSQECDKMIQNASLRDYSDDMILLRDKVVAFRNLEEEIARIGERNRIQLSDVQEEILNQKKELLDMESDISHLFDTAEEALTKAN